MTALRLGTRGSALALAQAHEVAGLIGGDVELVRITTAGDVDRARGDKSRWVGALEAALLSGEIDLAVHSAKDVPGELAAGTAIAATPRRAEPFDVLVGEHALADVREGARVGTSALRRRAQLLAARPDLEVRELRGNVDTRLAKRVAGEVDVLILAAAGLERLQRRGEAGGVLHEGVFVPAAGQGVIAVQARTPSAAADAAAAAVNHAATMACLQAERAAIRALGASCHAPVGVSARLVAESLQMRGFAGLPDGSEWVLDEHAAAVAEPGSAPDARRTVEAGRELARRMQLAGADDVLRRAEEAAA